MNTDTIILLCGLHSLGFALFHASFWKLFRWPLSLRDTTLANRAILQIANVQLIWLFLFVAALCFLFPQALATTQFGRALLAGMSAFWLLRLVVQFVFLRVNQALVHALSALFALGAALFALPLFL